VAIPDPGVTASQQVRMAMAFRPRKPLIQQGQSGAVDPGSSGPVQGAFTESALRSALRPRPAGLA